VLEILQVTHGDGLVADNSHSKATRSSTTPFSNTPARRG
jgi:hypothetical protein